jgi:hypothetical protein
MDRTMNAFNIIAGLIFNPEIRNEEGIDPLINEYFWDMVNVSYGMFKGIVIKRGDSSLYCKGRDSNSEIPNRNVDIDARKC